MHRTGWAAAVSLSMALGVAGCDKKKEVPASDDIGAQTADIHSDTETLRKANAAAGEVVRAAGDCDAVKAALPEARRELDEVAGKVQTATGRATLDGIRKRVDSIAEGCP
jgi:hypothetical protein